MCKVIYTVWVKFLCLQSFKCWPHVVCHVNTLLNKLIFLENTFNPDLIIIGGGVSKKMDKFEEFININTPIKAAELKNNAGIIGASIFAKKAVKG